MMLQRFKTTNLILKTELSELCSAENPMTENLGKLETLVTECFGIPLTLDPFGLPFFLSIS